MARERLTSRARQAADDKTPYPGSINQEGREEDGRGSNTYRTFEPSVANHELQDLRRVHGVSDQHNEIGFGIPDPASGMLVASSEYQAKCIKAAELAETFLGPKVGDRMLLAQARDFLVLSDEALDRTIERFNRTDSIYIAEEAEAEVEVEEEVPAVEAGSSCTAEESEEEESEEEEKEEKEEEKEEGAPEVEIDAAPATEAELAIDSAPQANAETGVSSREIPQMEEGSAASPTVKLPGSGGMSPEAAASMPETAVEEEVAMMSEARATNLANLASCTLEAHECTQENIIAHAQSFANLSDSQVKILLASHGREAIETSVPAEAKVEIASDNEIEVAQAQNLDIGSFDLSEEFNDGPITATPEEEAELASIFGDAPMAAPLPQGMNSQQALMASISQLTGGQVKTASSKLGVKSIGNVTLQQQNAPAQSGGNELESLWDAPADFPGGGF